MNRRGVVHVIGRLNVGGPAHLVTALGRTGERTVVAAGAVQSGEVEHVHLSGLDLRRIAGLGRRVSAADDARALAGLVRLLRAEHPRVIHTHTAKAGALGRAAAELARVPARVHTFHGHLLHGYFGPRGRAAVVTAERVLARRTDCLVAVGQRVRDELLEAGIGAPEQYVVVPPGIELGTLPERAASRRALGLPPDAAVVAYVGRLAGIKRPERVIEVARRVPGAVFLVVGDGAARARLEATAPANVRFTGWRADVAPVWAAADVALLTSDNEGMPVTLIEAALAGVPAVTTDVGSAAEVVIDGVTGAAVTTDVDALAAAVERLLADDDLRRRQGAAAQVRAAQEYSSARMVQRHREIYESISG